MHYLLPFIVVAGLCVHLCMLHVMGSGSASTVPGATVDSEPFIMYYYKDYHQVLHQLVAAIASTTTPSGTPIP